MSQPTTDELEAKRLASRTEYVQKVMQEKIDRRWGVTNWDVLFPWWRPPVKIRILMYADGGLHFSGGTLGGLLHVSTLLKSRLYPYVDFEITTAHRDRDLSAAKPSVRLTSPDLDGLNNFDEVWLFGSNSTPVLTEQELDLLTKFMEEKKRGLLVTGDHEDLGKSLAGDIPRAREMRQYPAPGSGPKEPNTTIEEGPDANDDFNEADQKDDRPQKIRNILFPISTPVGFRQRFRPHPVMCAPDGPIDVFPDHKHEGEAITPECLNAAEWPKVGGHQERPVVIAKGKIKDPEVERRGQEIGLVSAYDGHKVNVGRIIADSSWHHWVDVNLTGSRFVNPPEPDAGFDATPQGRAVLRRIDSYFLNCATWLAPPNLQAEMRRAIWWAILWTDQISELSIDAPIWHLGAEAIEALELFTSSGFALEWVLNIPSFKERISNQPLLQITEQFQLLNIPFEQYIAGGIIRALMSQVGPANPKLRFPSNPQPDEVIESAINDGVKFGMDALTDQLSCEAKRLLRMVKNNFR